MILLDVLDKYVFSGVPSNAAWDLIKTAWERANRKSWEDLYLDAFQAAVDEARPLLTVYTKESQVALDRSALSEALHRDLVTDVEALQFSLLNNAEFVTELAAVMEARSVLIIGGHNLSRDGYMTVVHNLARRATALFKTAILSNEPAFRRMLLDEALINQSLVQQVQAYLAKQFGLTLEKLDTIESKIDDQIKLTQQVAADVRELKQWQPQILAPPEPTCPPEVPGFIGREAELAYFSDRLATAHLAVITGIAGVGKTSLAAVLARRVTDPGKTFWHSFHEGESIHPIIWKLAGFLALHGEQDLWHTLQNARWPNSQPPPLEVLVDYLVQKIDGQGFLLCFDDFHSVDDDPLMNRFVQRLRKGTLPGSVLLIITSRRVPEFVRTTEFEPLYGLNLADTQSLLDQRGLSLSTELAADLHARTEGNAQLLTLAIGALQCSASPESFIARLAEASDIRRYLMSEIDECLNEDEREVMYAVSVLLGYPGTRDAIEAVLDKGGVQPKLNKLTDRYLLATKDVDAGREYGQHAIVQAFYFNLLGQRQRRPMHRRAGEHYSTFEMDTLKAARHFLEAEDHVRAAGLATENVWDVINRGQSGTLLQLLKRVADQQMGAELSAKVNIAQGQVYDLWGEGQLAQECYQAALARLAALRKSPSVRVLLGRACRGMGESLQYESPQEALVWLQRGLDELAAVGGPEEAALHIDIGRVQIGRSEYAAALSALEQGLGLLPAGPSQWRASALGNMGLIHCAQGHIEQGKELYYRALEISEQLHDYWRIVAWRHNLGIEMETAGDWQGASVEYREASELAERLGSISYQTELVLSLGILCTKRGDDEDAAAHLLKCIELARRHDLNEHLVHGLSSLADLRVRLGEWDVAEGLLNEAEQLAAKIGTRYQFPEIYRGWAQVHLARNRVQAAMDYAERSIDLAHELGLDVDEGMSLRVLGQALHANGQQEQAVAAFEKSLSILADRDPYEAARTKVGWGAYLMSAGEVERGMTLLNEAHEKFVQLGAQRELGDMERLLKPPA